MARIRRAGAYLEGRGVATGTLDAGLLFEHLAGVGRLDMHLGRGGIFAPDELAAFRALVRRRGGREPLQYLVGSAAFRELELSVDRRVLVPRPETELLVGETLAWAWRRVAAAGREAGLSALDVGTGSGAIALSLLLEGPFDRVVATDVCADALRVAETNAGRLGLADRLELRLGPCFEPIADGERFDAIVSNPPYVASAELAGLDPEVRDWEPVVALDGGPDGFGVIRTLLAGSGSRIAPGGMLAVEVGHGQARRAETVLASDPSFRAVRVIRDLAGRERFVSGEVRGVAAPPDPSFTPTTS